MSDNGKRLKEKLWMRLAWVLPKQLVYWCGIRIIGFAATGRYSKTVVTELPVMEAIRRWSSKEESESEREK